VRIGALALGNVVVGRLALRGVEIVPLVTRLLGDGDAGGDDDDDDDDDDGDSDSFSGNPVAESDDDCEDTKDEPSMERKTEHK
jgi:hypothetical protein